MKVMHSKDYILVGHSDGWYEFQNKHYSGDDAEVVKVRRAKFFFDDGSSTYLDVTPCNDDSIRRVLKYQKLLEAKQRSCG